MISQTLLTKILGEGRCLHIAFAGLPFKNTGRVSIYQHHGRFIQTGKRLQCEEMGYSRHVSKIIMICKGDQLLYGQRCKRCKEAVPKVWGNCPSCYCESLESKWR